MRIAIFFGFRTESILRAYQQRTLVSSFTLRDFYCVSADCLTRLRLLNERIVFFMFVAPEKVSLTITHITGDRVQRLSVKLRRKYIMGALSCASWCSLYPFFFFCKHRARSVIAVYRGERSGARVRTFSRLLQNVIFPRVARLRALAKRIR